MSRPESTSASGSGSGDGYIYPAYPAPGESYPLGSSLYSIAGPHNQHSGYGHPAPFPPLPHPSHMQGMHVPRSASITQAHNAQDVSPRRTASSSKSQQLADDAQDDDGDGAGKRRRVQRACDVCRRKKVRCDGPQPGKGACTNCITYNQVCRFEEATKRRAPPRSYTEALEARMERVEQLLSELAPGVDFTNRIGLPVRLPDHPPRDHNQPDSPPKPHFVKPPPIPEPSEPARSILPLDVAERDSMIARLGGRLQIKSEDSDDDSRDQGVDEAGSDSYSAAEDIAYVSSRAEVVTLDEPSTRGFSDICSQPATEADSAEPLSIEQQGQAASFFGNSSAFHLIPALERLNKKSDLREHLANKVVCRMPNFPGMRIEYWTVPRCLTVSLWDEEEAKELEIFRSVWPAPDLEGKLIDAFFKRPHNEYPVLSEPQFRADLKNHLKRKDREWVVLAMSVFAVASLYVDDERVLVPAYKDDFLLHTRGAQWFNACRRIGFRLSWSNPSLSHTQFMLLIIVYLLGTPLAQNVGWSCLGNVLRGLQYAGAHRKITAVRLQYPLHIEECWRRCWWTAYSLDREMATMFGRPVSLQDEDFDIDPPLRLDDDLLSQGRDADGKLPVQPADRPPRIDGFACRLKLDEITGKTLRTIYAISKAKASRGIAGKGWDQLIVADLDSMLNQWLDTVPAHLTYDPDEPNDEYLIQSTLLHAKYYYAQTLIHRPFIVGPRVHSSLNFPSLAIVTNASRLAAQMLHNLCKRRIAKSAGFMTTSLTFECGCVLQLVRWGSKRSGLRASSGAMDDIRKCLEVLTQLEQRWPVAGKLNDLLQILLKASDIEDDGESVQPLQGKRKVRTEQNGASMAADTSSEDASTASRCMIGLQRGRQSLSGASHPTSGFHGMAAFPLPLSTQDLGITPSTSTPEVSSENASPASGAALPHNATDSRKQSGISPHPQAQSSVTTQWMKEDVTQSASSSARNEQPRDWRQKQFIDSLSDLNTSATGGMGNNSIFDPTFPSPLDLPSFSSALFAQGGGGGAGTGAGGHGSGMTTGFGGEGGGPSNLTPGFSNFFGSTGLTPYAQYGNGEMQQDHQQQQQQQQHGIGQVDQAQNDQQQFNFGAGGDSDPFAHVFRDLLAAQDFFSEAGGSGGGSTLHF